MRNTKCLFALVDTNCDHTKVDFAVPGNDDAAKSVQVITDYLVNAIKELSAKVTALEGK